MEGKAFRGDSGEVLRGFLSFGTFLTAVPVGLATVLLIAAAGYVQERMQLPPVVTVPAVLTLMAPITGLFAMAARAGGLRAGFFEALAGHGGQGVGGFTARHGLLQAAWSVPLVFALQHLDLNPAGMLLGEPGPKLTLTIWLAVAVAGACLAAHTLTLLVATRTDSIGEAFSPTGWRWVLVERRADLVPYLASAVGGMTLFVVGTIPVLALALPIAMDVSPRLGQMLLAALPALPFATAPILVGRLAGAFVGSEPVPGATSPGAIPSGDPRHGSDADAHLAVASRTHAALAGLPRGTSPVRLDTPTNVNEGRNGSVHGLPLGVAIARAHQLAESDPVAAVEELESLRAANPRNAAIAAELARVLRLASRTDDAVQMAANAIRLALVGGAGPIAHDVFRSFAHEAAALNLEPAIYEQLGRILTARREYDGASWCYRAAAALGGDPKPLQRGMLSVAETAAEHGQHDCAAAVYDEFLATWPESVLASFARDSAETARRKSQTSSVVR